MDRENNSLQEKHQFRSYYCEECNQTKPCRVLTSRDYCCFCYYQIEQEKSQAYLDFQPVYQQELKEQQVRFQQLELLKNYPGCPPCKSLEVDAYYLYESYQLVCQPCLLKKTAQASSPISFSTQERWYKKAWGIKLVEWLEQFLCLPVNAECAREWLKDQNHLNNCRCLEKYTHYLVNLHTNSLREIEEKFKKCRCKASEKFRVDYFDSTGSGWVECQNCQKKVESAGHHGVIKNRNDPNFWGLEMKEKVLCGECLEKLVGKMPTSKKYTFNKYIKRRYWK